MTTLEHEFARILDGEASHAEILDFLERSIAWMNDPAAIAAGANALRARMVTLRAPDGAIDVCGTGGDGAHTLNISTAVAFVVAGAGVPVAKHGNRAMSSRCGAADVLEALGVKLTGDIATLERALEDAGVAFLFAQNHHPAMRHVGPARREIAKRTIFNLLGPLSNPAGVTRQLLGVFAPDFVAPVSEALRLLGATRAWVVCGPGNLDELFPADGNRVVELANGDIVERPLVFSGQAADDARAALKGGDAMQNAQALRALLVGQSQNEAYRQIVELNAGAALVAAGACADLGEALLIARESLDGREALARLDALIAITNDAPEKPA